MPRRLTKIFECPVVHETVQISLKRRGLFGRQELFVQCNQLDCQYVEENKPPCPLTPALFPSDLPSGETVPEGTTFNM